MMLKHHRAGSLFFYNIIVIIVLNLNNLEIEVHINYQINNRISIVIDLIQKL